MRFLTTLLAGLGFATAAAAQSPTLDAVRARGELLCGTNPGLVGFALPDAQGIHRGLDADTCRAVAAAVFGDAGKVRFVPLSTPDAPAALRDRRVDVVARNLTLTMTRDVEQELSVTAVNFYDGQGFLVPRAAGIRDVAQLAGASICVPEGSSNELALADFARRQGIAYTPVPVVGLAGFREAYQSGRCGVASADQSGLIALRQTGLADPAAHELLPDVISREPLGPLVRDGDPHWRSLVAWTVNALLEAEDLGITANNAEAMRASPSARIRRFLGAEPGLGAPLGLSDDWAFRVIRQVGNYGEVFERSLGSESPLALPRGLNAMYDRGGLMYPIPMR
jgi:general L-amino acid transport system substrate-binding protein